MKEGSTCRAKLEWSLFMVRKIKLIGIEMERLLLPLALLMLVALSAGVALAEPDEKEPAEKVPAEEVPAEDEGVVALPPTPEPVIPALDEWEEATPEATAAPTPVAVQPTDEEEETAPPQIQLQPPPIKGGAVISLTKEQKKRLEAVEKRIRLTVAEELKEQRERRSRDPRGEPELRVCSLNLNGYGEKDEVKRLIKEPGVKRLKATEKSAVKVISESGCGLVAVQGIVGRSTTFATAALAEFVKKLSKKSKVSWRSYVAVSEAQTGFQGVLLRENPSWTNHRFQTIRDQLLRRPGSALPPTRPAKISKDEIVQRDFVRFGITIKSAEQERDAAGLPRDKPSRELILLNGITARTVNPFDPEPPLIKAQIADVAFRLARAEQLSVSAQDGPIIILALERLEKRGSVIDSILSGRFELDDFQRVCKFQVEEAVETDKRKTKVKPLVHDSSFLCEPKPERPQLFFDVSGMPQIEAKNKKTPVVPATNGLYVDERDLPLVRVGSTLKYASGAVPLTNGLPGAYLVWVDLNW